MDHEGCSQQNQFYREEIENVEVDRVHDTQTLDSPPNIYFPQVCDKVKPIKGQKFRNLEEVQEFYNSYAKEAGFSIRNSSTKKRKGTEEIIRKELVCYKEGKFERFVDIEAKRRRGVLKAGCNAKLVVVKAKTDSYIVTIFREEHNHPLATPRKTHLLRSHRQVSAAAKCLTEQLSMVNIPPHQQYSLLQVQSGGIENVGCIERDLLNYRRDERMEVKGHDGDMLHEYFKLEQSKNPSFFFKIEADDEQRITRCFWADATSRRAYKFYGDVVIFDTTYNTNRYGMIFAPFVGVNNHGQTTIFACAFLNNELTDSFVWLFNQFLKVMPGDAPKMIITDQDPAMDKAISLALPTTFHRYCSWHILMKFSEKIGAGTCSKYYNDFHDCIWNSESCEDFDLKWMGIVEKAELEKNDWLNTIYRLRSKWIPVYVNHVFSANMSSSQRAESSHSFFKKFVSKNNSLIEFMIQSSRGLVKQRHQELIADNKDIMEKPKVKTNHHFSLHMVEIYTREMFYKFQDEMWEVLNYSFELVRENENEEVFKIKRKLVETNRVREIIYNKRFDYASCSCRMFESSGIPCRHVLAYLIKFHDSSKLPEQYILKRWTKEAKVGMVIDDGGMHINDDTEYLLRRSQLVKSCFDAIEKALVSDEATLIFKVGLENVVEKINTMQIDGGSGRNSNEKSAPSGGCSTSVNGSANYEHVFKEPIRVRAKGCGKRLKGGKEKVMGKGKKHKPRMCHGCGKTGQTHDKRNCPKLLNLFSSCNEDANLVEENDSSSEDEDKTDKEDQV